MDLKFYHNTAVLNQPLISVLMTVYNGMPYLHTTIECLLTQTYSPVEIVVVDDASTDTTITYLRGLNHPKIKIISKGKLGRGYALNEGLKHCSGKYIAINDADDYSLPERLIKQVAFLETHPEYGLVGANFIKAFPDGRKEYSDKPTDNDTLRLELSKHSCIQHSAVLFRKSVLDQIGGYNTSIKYLFDRDIYIRVAEISKIANLPEHLVVINRHEKQFFLHSYKGFERKFHALKYNLKAIQHLHLPKQLYIRRVLAFGYSTGTNFLRGVIRLWRK